MPGGAIPTLIQVHRLERNPHPHLRDELLAYIDNRIAEAGAGDNPLPSDAEPTALQIGVSGSAGTATRWSRGNHRHALPSDLVRTDALVAEAAIRADADASLDERVAALEYVAPDISGLSNNVGTVEIGSTVDDVTLTWSLNKAMSTLDIASPGPGAITPSLLTYAMTGLGLTADQTFTVTASDGIGSDAATTSVLFRRKRYWGVDAAATPDASTIAALAGAEFATSRSQSRSMTASAEYLYFAWPSTFGTPSFTVNGLGVTGWQQTTISYTNPSGHTENYDIWRSPYPVTGTFAVVVS